MKFCQSMMFAPPDQWLALTKAAEEAGFDEIALSDHVFYPEKLESKYPYSADGTPRFAPETPWPDVWVTMGALAAVTSRIRFVTNVYVLPARNPFVVAKAVGTAAYLSGGRVSLGIGAGWMREEFDALEQPFERRGKRMEEMMDVLRLLWGGGAVEFHGEFYDFDPLTMSPAPPGPVPMLIGGHSDIALRRAATIADGWIGVDYDIDTLEGYIARLHEQRQAAGTMDRPFEITASPIALPTPDVLERLEAVGVTTILTSAWLARGLVDASLEENLDALAQFGAQYIRR